MATTSDDYVDAMYPRDFGYAGDRQKSEFLLRRERLRIEHACAYLVLPMAYILLSTGRIRQRIFDGLLAALGAKDHSYYPIVLLSLSSL
jgi:hypothetical protein